MNPLPHDQVLVRLAPSPIHGIGVFAQQPIAAGTNVFANDTRAICWVSADLLAALPLEPWQRAFYDDFAIRKDGMLGCPDAFDLLTPGWYVNEPPAGSEPNLVPSPEFDLIAAREIAAGEELTVSYSAFASAGDRF
jgi:hypothetical protein